MPGKFAGEALRRETAYRWWGELLPGAWLDAERADSRILDEIGDGKRGWNTLEAPPDEEEEGEERLPVV
jgi:hypothetical protein